MVPSFRVQIKICVIRFILYERQKQIFKTFVLVAHLGLMLQYPELSETFWSECN